MQVSIIVALLNAEREVRTLFDSIATYCPRCQVIVWDGGSTDHTVARVAQYSRRLENMIIKVGKDKGIYDAWNKALDFCNSGWVMFLGAGDRLVSPVVFDSNAGAQEIYSFGVAVRKTGVNLSIPTFQNFRRAYWHGIPSPNPGTIYPRLSIIKVGGFDVDYKISGDYDMQLRLIDCGHTINRSFANRVIVEFETGGISSRRDHVPESLTEMARALRKSDKLWSSLYMNARAFAARLKNFLGNIDV